MSVNRRRGGHRRADQVGSAATTLATLEITVRCGRAMLAIAQLVGVHRQTHGAARLTPLQARFNKYLVQPLLFGLLLHKRSTWS